MMNRKALCRKNIRDSDSSPGVSPVIRTRGMKPPPHERIPLPFPASFPSVEMLESLQDGLEKSRDPRETGVTEGMLDIWVLSGQRL